MRDPKIVSYNMSRIGSRDTKPELALRRALHARGLRYRVHEPLPGKPDIVFRGPKVVVFVDGEFWQPKTARNRVVPISKVLMDYLLAYQSPKGTPWYFPSPQGCRWDPDNFSHKLRKLNRAQDLQWSCAEYRHTFGSQLAMKGESLYPTLPRRRPAMRVRVRTSKRILYTLPRETSRKMRKTCNLENA